MENAIQTESSDATMERAHELGTFLMRVLTFWFVANALQSFGLGNRILENGLTAFAYGVEISYPIPSPQEEERFRLLRERAELVIRVFLEDHYTEFGQLGKNPLLRRTAKAMEKEEEGS